MLKMPALAAQRGILGKDIHQMDRAVCLLAKTMQEEIYSAIAAWRRGQAGWHSFQNLWQRVEVRLDGCGVVLQNIQIVDVESSMTSTNVVWPPVIAHYTLGSDVLKENMLQTFFSVVATNKMEDRVSFFIFVLPWF